ncbi:MAG: transglutaminase family protein [Caulobacteraceae bacterium]|nr:transglutaminase family protein [Caulobacter sp.]
MRIRVRYDTVYRYERPLRSAIQHLRLEPRAHDAQRVSRWRVRVDGPGRLRKGEDAHGNVLHTLYLSDPVDRLRIHAEGEVETTDTAGVLAGAPEPFAPAVFLRETPLTAADDALRAMAQAAAERAGSGRLAQLHELLRSVAERIRFDVGGTGPSTTAAQALEGGHGVCQDMAHAFIAAARRLGAPSRYVSGHLLRPETERQDAGHAWAEAHVEGLGWVGFDPANRRSPTEAYLRVACGPDSLSATPIRGVRLGGGAEVMTVDLSVTSPQKL